MYRLEKGTCVTREFDTAITDEEGRMNAPNARHTALRSSKFPIVERVFLTYASSGCGIGCSYCYIDHPSSPPVYYPDEHYRLQIEQLEATDRVIVAALAPDTDPFVTPESIERSLFYLRACESSGAAVQLSTKCRIPPDVRVLLDNWSGKLRPIIFTSMTSFDLHDRLEPGAPHPEERAKNFGEHAPSWVSAALVKPLLSISSCDQRRLVDLLLATKPEAVVVGARYRKVESVGATQLRPHPFASDWSGSAPTDAAIAFARRLESEGIPLFRNTECVVDYFNDCGIAQTIYTQYHDLCTNCGLCPERELLDHEGNP